MKYYDFKLNELIYIYFYFYIYSPYPITIEYNLILNYKLGVK
jgi:hypothetical protein